MLNQYLVTSEVFSGKIAIHQKKATESMNHLPMHSQQILAVLHRVLAVGFPTEV
jgi:hypothetical protein